MRKILIVLIAFFMVSTIETSFAASKSGGRVANNASSNRQTGSINHEQLMFIKKFQSCSPASYEATGEEILGRTRDGKCRYIYKESENSNELYYCVAPMQVIIGYTSTMLDADEYASTQPEIAQERIEQNAEIKKIMHDYCKKIQR